MTTAADNGGDANITEFPIPTPPASGFLITPGMITAGPDGNLWFAESYGDKIGRITPDGSITEFTTPTPASGPKDITVGPDKNFWFIESNLNKMGG